MNETASVELLTAEVQVLMIGNRQVTLSVFSQLDDEHDLEPFGRVRTSKGLWLIGRSRRTGALVRSSMSTTVGRYQFPEGADGDTAFTSYQKRFEAEHALPLIVLAGLR